jgi:hypothetical protein
MNPNNERVYFYRYYKAVPRSQRQRSWTKLGDTWKFLNYPCASFIIRNIFDRKHAFIIDFELRSNTPVQFYQGSKNNVHYIREVINCNRDNLERIGPFYLDPDETMEFIARPTFRMLKSTAGKSHKELKDEEKYLWMEFYRANVYVQP